MANTRLDLQALFEGLLSSRNVYFQPPESKRLNYPCIVYHLANIRNTPADNIPYLQGTAYTIIYITDDPDDIMVKTLSKLPLCRFDRWYAANNLNHYSYLLYY